jgi:hypothetical protein
MIAPGNRKRLEKTEGWRTAESYGMHPLSRQRRAVTVPSGQRLLEGVEGGRAIPRGFVGPAARARPTRDAASVRARRATEVFRQLAACLGFAA